MSSKIQKKILDLIGENNIKNNNIKNLKDISNWDSLKYIELILNVESFLKKKLTEKEIMKLQKIDEIKKFIKFK